MNHRYRPGSPGTPHMPVRRPTALLFTLFFLLVCSWCSPASAQRAGGGLPADLKSAADARPRRAEIEKFITAQVAKLQKGKVAEREAARDLLDRESKLVGAAPSPSYLEVYATVLNKQLVGLAKHEVPHARLNAAIALQRVAKNANNGALAVAATTFAQDPSAGVVLWAAKAAQFIIPPLATAGKTTKLTAALVAGVRKHPDSGDLADEAYKALTMEIRNNPQRVNESAVGVLLPDVLKLFEFRVQQYEKTTPPAPRVDERGAIFLTIGRVWSNPATAKSHPAIMQQLSNLIGFTAQHVAAREENDARKQFTDLLQQAGDALTVVADARGVKDAELKAAAKALVDISPATENEELTTRAEAAYAAIQAKFPNTKPAPPIADDAAVDAEEAPEEPPAAREEEPAAREEEPAEREEEPAADDAGAEGADADPADEGPPPRRRGGKGSGSRPAGKGAGR